MFSSTSSGSGAMMTISRLLTYALPVSLALGFVAIIVIGIIVPSRISRLFGHGIGMSLGLIILPFIFYLILGFDKSVYQPLNAQTPVVPPIIPTPPAPPMPPVMSTPTQPTM